MKSKRELFENYKALAGSNLCSSCMKKIDDNKTQCDKCRVEEKKRIEKILGIN